jgi:hypothetical protein
MKDIHEYEKDLASIRSMMERSAKVLSLSGLAGVLAGIYALAGAVAAYYIVHYPISPLNQRIYSIREPDTLSKLIAVAAVVLIASLTTGVLMSNSKARKSGQSLWNPASKQMVFNMAVPLVSGGVFILTMLYTGHFGLAAPACLVFYGIALIQASVYTVNEVRYLGFCEIALGLVSAVVAGYGLIFWAIGFGVLHIIYGSIMYNRYDK